MKNQCRCKGAPSVPFFLSITALPLATLASPPLLQAGAQPSKPSESQTRNNTSAKTAEAQKTLTQPATTASTASSSSSTFATAPATESYLALATSSLTPKEEAPLPFQTPLLYRQVSYYDIQQGLHREGRVTEYIDKTHVRIQIHKEGKTAATIRNLHIQLLETIIPIDIVAQAMYPETEFCGASYPLPTMGTCMTQAPNLGQLATGLATELKGIGLELKKELRQLNDKDLPGEAHYPLGKTRNEENKDTDEGTLQQTHEAGPTWDALLEG